MKKQRAPRRNFTRELKLGAVRRVVEGGRSSAEVARERVAQQSPEGVEPDRSRLPPPPLSLDLSMRRGERCANLGSPQVEWLPGYTPVTSRVKGDLRTGSKRREPHVARYSPLPARIPKQSAPNLLWM